MGPKSDRTLTTTIQARFKYKGSSSPTMEAERHKGWDDGVGWTAEELVWTDADTEMMNAFRARNEKTRPVTYDEIKALHESLKF